MKNVKGKTIGLLFMVAMSLPLIWPQTISKAQTSVKPIAPVQTIVDSINEQKDKAIDLAIQVASTLPAMSNMLARYVRKNQTINKSQPILQKPQVVVRYNGEIYDVKPEAYKGYLIVDYDKFFQDIDTGSNKPVPAIDTLINGTAPVKKRSWLFRLFHKN